LSFIFNLISGVEQISFNEVWLESKYFYSSKFYFVGDVAFKLLLLNFTPRYNNKENPVLKLRESHFLYSGRQDANCIPFITAKNNN